MNYESTDTNTITFEDGVQAHYWADQGKWALPLKDKQGVVWSTPTFYSVSAVAKFRQAFGPGSAILCKQTGLDPQVWWQAIRAYKMDQA